MLHENTEVLTGDSNLVDETGVVYYELLQPHHTINGEFYKPSLVNLKQALKQKCLECVTRHNKVVFPHDNIPPHGAKPVKDKSLRWYLNFKAVKVSPVFPYD